MHLLRRRREQGLEVSVGISIDDGTVTLAAFDGEVDGRPHVSAWEIAPYDSPERLHRAIQRFVETHGLRDRGCRCILPAHDVSIRLVERPPNVPDDELVDATRWLVRDLIEFDVETAELALFKVPEDDSRARTPRMFVVAARHDSVLELAQAIEAIGLRLEGFETIETTLLALESRMPPAIAGSAMLHVSEKASVLTLSHDEALYLSRNVHVDTDSIEQAARMALEAEDPRDPEIMGSIDGLLLDVQRSLDYYESECGQAPASRLTLLPSQVDMTPLLPGLSETFRPMQIELFEPDRYLDFAEPPFGLSAPAVTLAAGVALAGPEPLGAALVPSGFRTHRGGLGLAACCQIAALVALFLGVVVGLGRIQLGEARADLTELEARRGALTESIDAERAEAAARAVAYDPEAELARLRAERKAGLSMLRALGERSERETTSFSSLLTALARQDLEGIWLERVAFADAGASILIEGRTLEADDVPRFLRGLGSEPSFEDRRFRRFEMDRGAGSSPGIAFRVATDQRDADGEEGG